MPGLAAFFVGASNITLLGQDQVMFMAVHGSELQWTGNFQDSEVPLWHGLLVPQAWTLGVELAFYIVAPVVLRTKRRLLAVFFLSLLLRAAFIYWGFGMVDPWRYRFFPTELCVFLLGAISHQFVRPKIDQISEQLKKRLGNIVVVLGLVFVVFFSAIPTHQYLKGALLFIFVIGTLPLLFDFQNRSKFDNFVGQLSYPVYIWHMLVISCIGIIPVNLDHGTLEFFIVTLVGSLVLSWLSLRFIDKPVQKLRARFRNRDFRVAPNGLAPLA
jgi:peptidoglycan/LPS O-acetylase OafA/YrhL